MIAVFSTLIVFTVSLVVVRIASVGLAMTGVSKDLAQFQALSAFTGSGFTTKESEDIVNHPLRRRIAMHLMLLGHVGVVVAIPSVVLSFLNTGGNSWSNQLTFRVGVMAGGLLLLYVVANSQYVEQLMWQINTWALRRTTGIQVQDYTRLLRIAQSYVIWELHVHDGDWLAGHTLEQLRLASEGVLVLGIERPTGEYLGAPRGQTKLAGGDCLILYGRQEALIELDERQSGMDGNIQHLLAVTREMDMREGGTSVDEDNATSHDDLNERPADASNKGVSNR